MAEQQDSIFREIDEEMRREQIAKIWKEYGTYILGAVLAVILAVAGYQIYTHRRQAAIIASGDAYDAAQRLIADGKTAEATAALEKIAHGGPAGYATLAQLRLGAAAVRAGKTAEAVATYDALAKDPATDRQLADFARLQAAALRVDQADWTEMQNRLIDLTDNANAWRYSARELMALAALKDGQIEQARKFGELLLGERRVPPSILERVKVMLAMLIEKELAATSAAGGTAKPEAPTPGSPGKPAEAPK